jgi:hypothetical protein
LKGSLKTAMHIRKLAFAILLVFLIAGAHGQQEQRSVLLSANEIKQVASLYPKKGPESIKGSWQPTQADIDSLEANLSQVSHLESNYRNPLIRIDHPEQYFRQYIGVLQSSQKRIFVNAFYEVESEPNWRNRLVIVSDGATCFWHALYDPITATFSGLEINSRA